MLGLTWGFGLVLILALSGRVRLALASAAALTVLSVATRGFAPATLPWCFQIAVLCSTPLLVERASAWSQRRLPWRQRLEEHRATLDRLTADWEILVEQNRQREAQADSLQQFYTITKAAAPALHTGELIATTAAAFHRFCAFRLLRFLQVEMSDGAPCITAVYEWHDGLTEALATPCRITDGRLLRRYLASPEATMLTAEETVAWGGAAAPVAMGWTPLLVEARLAGLLAIEGLEPAFFDRFLIVADQAALQLARVQLYQRLETLSITDGLTGVFVRRHFLQRVQEELLRAQRLGWQAALLMLDLDHFKQQNDRYGHLAGDAILREIAQRLRAQVRQIDILGRLGGEEFGVFLSDTTAAEVGQAAERIRSSIAATPIRAYDETVPQTISIGIALYPQDGTTLEILLEHADAALYQAKMRGRNRLVFHGA